MGLGLLYKRRENQAVPTVEETDKIKIMAAGVSILYVYGFLRDQIVRYTATPVCELS